MGARHESLGGTLWIGMPALNPLAEELESACPTVRGSAKTEAASPLQTTRELRVGDEDRTNEHDFLQESRGTSAKGFCSLVGSWRRGSESNRRGRLCRPLHDHSATPPGVRYKEKRGKRCTGTVLPSGMLERETSLELATSTMARLRSTN